MVVCQLSRMESFRRHCCDRQWFTQFIFEPIWRSAIAHLADSLINFPNLNLPTNLQRAKKHENEQRKTNPGRRAIGKAIRDG